MRIIASSVVAASFLLALAAFVKVYSGDHRTVYINMGKLYHDFQLSKELNKELETTIRFRKNELDSLYRSLKAEAERAENEKNITEEKKVTLLKMQEEYLQKQEAFEKESQEETARCEKKIWSQVNQYLVDYGRNNDYSFILGASGDGNIMYANSEIDVTGEVTDYLNNRYNGNSY